jgi:hypothetical protein
MMKLRIIDKQHGKYYLQQRIKIIGQLVLNSMAWAYFRSRQIFKFGLLRKKDNKKKLKIRLVFNRMVSDCFQPYYSYTRPLPASA